MADRDADTVVILSSELISKITEEYFNKTMFKQRVEIVDLKPTDSGYMFSVVFVQKVAVNEKVPLEELGYPPFRESTPEEFDESIQRLAKNTMARLSNGQFKKVSK